jgi:hypothetical protein
LAQYHDGEQRTTPSVLALELVHMTGIGIGDTLAELFHALFPRNIVVTTRNMLAIPIWIRYAAGKYG